MKSRIPHCICLLGRLNFLHPSQFLSLHLLLTCQYWRVLVSYFVKCSLFGLTCFCCCWLDLSHWAEMPQKWCHPLLGTSYPGDMMICVIIGEVNYLFLSNFSTKKLLFSFVINKYFPCKNYNLALLISIYQWFLPHLLLYYLLDVNFVSLMPSAFLRSVGILLLEQLSLFFHFLREQLAREEIRKRRWQVQI